MRNLLFLFLVWGVSSVEAKYTIFNDDIAVGDNVKPEEGSVFTVQSTTKVAIPCPKMTEVERDLLVSAPVSSCIYNLTAGEWQTWNGGSWNSVAGGSGGLEKWATGTAYLLDDVIYDDISKKIYQCTTTHTAGATFIGDISNWVELSAGGLSEWETAEEYELDDVIYDPTLNDIFRCTTAHTAGATFIGDIANWQKLGVNIDLTSEVTGVLPQANGGYLVLNGVTAPAVTPTFVGQIFVDTVAGITYTAFGTSSSADWKSSIPETDIIFNGSYVNGVDVEVSSNGTTAILEIEGTGSTDIPVILSGLHQTIDATPKLSVNLTSGTNTSPVTNYIYFNDSLVLTASTVGFPTGAEFIPVATAVLQSAASSQANGAYKVHNWTDHLIGSTGQGHLSHINAWIRAQNATWISGVALTPTVTTNGGGLDNLDIATTSGTVRQLHPHTFPAFDTSTGSDIYVINDSVSAYSKMTDLNGITLDSEGGSLSGRRYSLVIWGVASNLSTTSKLFVNLPSGSYNGANAALRDADNYTNYNIPETYKGTGFLIARLVVRHQTSGSGTLSIVENIDLRGQIPSIFAGGSAGSTATFSDSSFNITDNVDESKVLVFQNSGITTATTRTLTIPDLDGMIALLTGAQTFTDKTFTSPVLNTGVSGTAILDEDDLVSDSATQLATQQSIKAYVDDKIPTAGLPVMAKGSIITSNGIVNGEFDKCANGEIIEWDDGESAGVKCVPKPATVVPNIVESASSGAEALCVLTAPSITTSGGTLLINIVPADNSIGGNYASIHSGGITLDQDGTPIIETAALGSNGHVSQTFVITPSAGTYVYRVDGGSGNTLRCAYLKLVVTELK